MESTHDIIIIVIVCVIICIQLILFYRNLIRILAFKDIIPKNEDISLVNLTIDEDSISTVDPDTILKDKRGHDKKDSDLYTEEVEQFDFIEESEDYDEQNFI